MKKTFLLLIIGLTIWMTGYCQTDTISENIYQKNGYIGIGINDPGFLLQIEGNESSGIERNILKLHNNINGPKAYTGMILQTGSDVGSSVIQDYSTLYTASLPYDFAGFLNIGNSNNGIMFHARKQGIIKFYTGFDETAGAGIERLRIDSAGNLGLGTTNPVAKFQVADGDIYISDIDKGIIMKSPDGNCWRGTLDNSGQLGFTSIDCPEIGIVNNIQKLKSSDIIQLYPNPSNTLITIDLSNNKDKKLEYKIYNLSGQIQSSGKIKSDIQTINISNITLGAYMLSIYNKKGDKLISQKIIKE